MAQGFSGRRESVKALTRINVTWSVETWLVNVPKCAWNLFMCPRTL